MEVVQWTTLTSVCNGGHRELLLYAEVEQEKTLMKQEKELMKRSAVRWGYIGFAQVDISCRLIDLIYQYCLSKNDNKNMFFETISTASCIVPPPEFTQSSTRHAEHRTCDLNGTSVVPTGGSTSQGCGLIDGPRHYHCWHSYSFTLVRNIVSYITLFSESSHAKTVKFCFYPVALREVKLTFNSYLAMTYLLISWNIYRKNDYSNVKTPIWYQKYIFDISKRSHLSYQLFCFGFSLSDIAQSNCWFH